MLGVLYWHCRLLPAIQTLQRFGEQNAMRWCHSWRRRQAGQYEHKIKGATCHRFMVRRPFVLCSEYSRSLHTWVRRIPTRGEKQPVLSNRSTVACVSMGSNSSPENCWNTTPNTISQWPNRTQTSHTGCGDDIRFLHGLCEFRDLVMLVGTHFTDQEAWFSPVACNSFLCVIRGAPDSLSDCLM